MKTKILNLIILDESGSMDHIRKQTISGCNEILNTIRSAQTEFNETQEHYISIYVFQSEGIPSRYLFENQSVEDVSDIKEQDYVPCGNTPLYDAIGISVNNLCRMANQDELTIGSVTIITDGMENSSKEYTEKQVADLIGMLKEKGWNFNFIGANIDVEKISRHINIDNAMSFDLTCEGTSAMFARESTCKKNWLNRICQCVMESSSDADNDTLSESLKEASRGYYEDKN